MNFTKVMGMPIGGHSDIDFVDIHVNRDTQLYIDPERVSLSAHPFARIATDLIESFFGVLCDIAKSRDYDAAYQLLSYGREPNETHLGLSEAKSRGKGTTPEILMPIIEEMIDLGLFDNGLVSQLGDLQLWTPNFHFDRLSDLTTNIIRSALIQYTDFQYSAWNLPTSEIQQRPTTVWDDRLCKWVQKPCPSFYVDGYPVLLVPKEFVGRSMLSSPGELLQKYALRYRQQGYLDANSDYCHRRTNRNGEEIITPPTKREVYAMDVQGSPSKEFLRQIGNEHPQIIHEFHASQRDRGRNGEITIPDWELDRILYGGVNNFAVG